MIVAKCMRCGHIHSHYRFKKRNGVIVPICYLLFCIGCGATNMHEPVEIGLTQRALDAAHALKNWLVRLFTPRQ